MCLNDKGIRGCSLNLRTKEIETTWDSDQMRFQLVLKGVGRNQRRRQTEISGKTHYVVYEV